MSGLIDLNPFGIEPDELSFTNRQFSPTSRGQTPQLESANLNPEQTQGRMPYGRCHATHLAIFTFNQLQAQPAGRDSFAKPNRRVTRRQLWLRSQYPRPARKGLMRPDLEPFFQIA